MKLIILFFFLTINSFPCSFHFEDLDLEVRVLFQLIEDWQFKINAKRSLNDNLTVYEEAHEVFDDLKEYYKLFGLNLTSEERNSGGLKLVLKVQDLIDKNSKFKNDIFNNQNFEQIVIEIDPIYLRNYSIEQSSVDNELNVRGIYNGSIKIDLYEALIIPLNLYPTTVTHEMIHFVFHQLRNKKSFNSFNRLLYRAKEDTILGESTTYRKILSSEELYTHASDLVQTLKGFKINQFKKDEVIHRFNQIRDRKNTIYDINRIILKELESPKQLELTLVHSGIIRIDFDKFNLDFYFPDLVNRLIRSETLSNADFRFVKNELKSHLKELNRLETIYDDILSLEKKFLENHLLMDGLIKDAELFEKDLFITGILDYQNDW